MAAVYSLEKVFPEGIKVLAVDDDAVCLGVLEAQLKNCGYIVAVTQHAQTALKLLRENKNNYDLVIMNVDMPGTDGFRLLETIGQEMDLPVIMLSSNVDDADFVMRGILHGAVDCLVKPVRVEELKLIWKHIIKKRTNKDCCDKNGRKTNDRTSNTMTKHVEEKEEETVDDSNSDEALRKHVEVTEEGTAEDSNSNEAPTNKRSRLVWTNEMQTKFVDAYNILGHERATPKRILERMNIQGLSRQNIASHLQKHRHALNKNGQGTRPHHTGYGSIFNGLGANRQITPLAQHQNFHNIHNLVANLENLRTSHDLLPLPNSLMIPLSSQPTQLGTSHAAYSSNLGQHSGPNTLGYSIPNCVTGRIEGSMDRFVQKPWNGSGDLGTVPSLQMPCSSRQEDHSSSFFDYRMVESVRLDGQSSFDMDTPAHYQGVSNQVDIVSSRESGLEEIVRTAAFQHFNRTHGPNNYEVQK